MCVATEREAQSLKRCIKLDRFSFEHIDPVNENMKSGKYNHKEKLLRVERVGKLNTSINLYEVQMTSWMEAQRMRESTAQSYQAQEKMRTVQR